MKLKIDKNIIFVPLLLILIWISVTNNQVNQNINSNTLSIISGNSGGTYYYIAAGQSKILSKELKMSVSTQSSSGSPVENLSLVSRDSGTLGIVTLDGYYFAKSRNRERGFEKKLDNIEVLQIGHIAYLYALVMEKSGITSFSQIKGMTIAVPPIGSSTYYMALAILNAYGCNNENNKIIPLSSSEQSEALKDGDIDVGFVAGGLSQATVVDLDFSNKINFLSIDSDIQKKLDDEYPYWYSSIIPNGTYKNQKDIIRCLTVNTMLVCNDKINEELAYKITKILNENTEQMGQIHTSGFEWNKETTAKFLDNNILRFNKGARRYYEKTFKK